MNHRNIEIKVRLNRKEAEALNKKVKKAGFPARRICAILSMGSSAGRAPARIF